MKKIIPIILSAILLCSCIFYAFAEDTAESFDSFGAYKHVFIIGVDGCGATWDKVDSPNFDRIFKADNAYRFDAHTEYVTVSAQNWGSILTGVAYDVHGFNNGSIEKNERSSDSANNSIFYYARKQFPDAELASFCNWDPINHGIIENDLSVKKVNRGTDPLVTQAIITYFDKGNAPALFFCQLDSVDHAAHTYGGFSRQYYEAAEKADGYLGDIYDAIERAGLLEDGLFIVVADHGETEDGHGGQTPEESAAVLAVAGKSVNAGEITESARNRDVASIALYALGIEQPGHMTSVVPEGLFGEAREKTIEPAEKNAFADFFKKFAYVFFRLVNALISVFDGSKIF